MVKQQIHSINNYLHEIRRPVQILALLSKTRRPLVLYWLG
jgi:hypothetical protein